MSPLRIRVDSNTVPLGGVAGDEPAVKYIYTTCEKKKNSSYGKTNPDIKLKSFFMGGRKVPQKTLVSYNVPGVGS